MTGPNIEFELLELYLKQTPEVFHTTVVNLWADLVTSYMGFDELSVGFLTIGKAVGISPTADREIYKLLKFKNPNLKAEYDF